MILCSCGAVYATSAAMQKIGWQPMGGGDAALLCNCPACHSTLCVEIAQDVAICVSCKRLVTGEGGDPKVVEEPADDHAPWTVRCIGCAERHGMPGYQPRPLYRRIKLGEARAGWGGLGEMRAHDFARVVRP